MPGKNRPSRKRQHLRYKSMWRGRARLLVEDAKARGCADCGYRGPAVALDLDHVRGVKVAGLARLVQDCNRPHALALVADEIAKCEVVCANCHRIRTARTGASLPLKYRDPLPDLTLPLLFDGVESGV